MAESFSGKVVWVTGASSGIGEALCQELASRGARLVLSARRESELARVRDTCTGGAERHAILPLDLEDLATLSAKADEAWERSGPIDVMVHNGGVSQRSLAVDTSFEVDQRIMTINYFGAVAITKRLLPRMLERRAGHFVVVTSLTGVFGTPYRSGYAASKHALHGFFDSLRAEVSDDGISVTIVCPGFVRTGVSLNALTGDGSKQGTMDEATEKGLSPAVCAREIARAAEKRRIEVYIGGFEKRGVYAKRLSPALFARVIKRANVK